VRIDKSSGIVTINLLSRNEGIRTAHNLFDVAVYSGTAIVQGNVYMPLQNLPIGSYITGIALEQDGHMLALELALPAQVSSAPFDPNLPQKMPTPPYNATDRKFVPTN